MKKLTLLVLFLCVQVCVSVPLSEKDLEKLVDQWRMEPPDSQMLNSISDEHRSQIITALRRQSNNNQDTVGQLKANKLLINFGDRETAAKVVEEFRSNESESWQFRNASEILERTTQPWIIPMIQSELFLDEPAAGWLREDVGVYPKSTTAAWIIRCILNRSLAFPSEVRDWTKVQVPHFGATNDPFRATMRQWWEQNKEAFARQDYAAVQPLKPVMPVTTPSTNVPASVSTPAAANVKKPKIVPPVTAPASTEPSTASSRYWLVGLLVILAGITGVMLWRKSRSQ